jgi:hypothetical protein
MMMMMMEDEGHSQMGGVGGSAIKVLYSILRIRIRRIRMFMGLLDPDPDPSVMSKNIKKNLESYCIVTVL